MLCGAAIKQFTEIYKKEFSVILTEDESLLKAQKTLSFFKTIINEISKDKKVNNFVQKGGVLNDNKDKSD